MLDKTVIQIPLHKPVAANIPAEKTQRDRLKAISRNYVRRQKLVGPLTIESLKQHTIAVLAEAGLNAIYLEFAVVVLNNEINLSILAKVPYEKRLLLLPRCLHDEKVCKGQFDDLGLLCRRCGGCAIDTLTDYAQQLGCSVLVAEGSPVVMGLLQSGGIEAVVGVSCLSMLEKVFPYMEAAAFPGAAVPLLYDGCAQTAFDADWLLEFLQYRDADDANNLDLRQLRQVVSQWFELESLKEICNVCAGPVETAAIEWLALAGKRWRPALAAGVWAALTGADIQTMPSMAKKMCVAIECFHKASLIHDDIEDGDEFRYEQKTLHAQFGVPVALNIGDYLIGLGYQLLAELDIAPEMKNQMLVVAAQGHRTLCLGQGAELDWMKKHRTLSVDEVLQIFEQKTVPAFNVALKLGAILADTADPLLIILERFSRYIGLAYQIHDDVQDWQSGDKQAARLSVLRVMPDEKSAQQAANELISGLHKQARDCLEEIDAVALKGFLRKVLAKIVDEFGKLSCCEDHSPRHS